jgi:hypothetical protein
LKAPPEYQLLEDSPDPFNSSITIKIGLPEASKMTLRIFNVFGKEIATFANDHLTAGYHNFSWESKKMSSGIYFVASRQYPQTDNKSDYLI